MAKKKATKKKKTSKGKGKSGKLMDTVKTTGLEMAGITAGIIGTQKFLDFKTAFKDQYAKDPKSALFEHEGIIKIGAALFAYNHSKNAPDFVRNAIIGVGIQGAIIAARKYTYDTATGTSIVSQIGGTDDSYMSAINALAAEVKSVAEQERTGVSGNEQKFNSNTGVSGSGNVSSVGMGMDDHD